MADKPNTPTQSAEYPRVLYRVGNHQPQNVYRGNQYIGVMFSAEDAASVVQMLNLHECLACPAYCGSCAHDPDCECYEHQDLHPDNAPMTPTNEVDDSLSEPGLIVYAPCQPIGCDNDYHLPGCVYAERDQTDGGAR